MKYTNKLVLHISPSPLVGAPNKICESLNRYTDYYGVFIALNDYPGDMKGKFSNDLVMNDNRNEGFIYDLLKTARIIHIHNYLDENFTKKLLTIIASRINQPKLIYHVHSPLREGPVFFEMAKYGGLNFDKKLVIAQHFSRVYPDYTIVPNIVTLKPSLNLLENDEKPKIIFSPSHSRIGGRWGDKVSDELACALDGISKLKMADVFNITKMPAYELFSLRRNMHITIDEIVTGGYHQVSLEALATGNVVINKADYFSCKQLEAISNNKEYPPFVYADNESIFIILKELLNDRERIRLIQQQSYDYFIENLKPENMISYFTKIYDEVLKDV